MTTALTSSSPGSGTFERMGQRCRHTDKAYGRGTWCEGYTGICTWKATFIFFSPQEFKTRTPQNVSSTVPGRILESSRKGCDAMFGPFIKLPPLRLLPETYDSFLFCPKSTWFQPLAMFGKPARDERRTVCVLSPWRWLSLAAPSFTPPSLARL